MLNHTETGLAEFASKIQTAMDAEGVSIKDISDATGATYEHIRRLVRGLVFPSRLMLKELCKVLPLDFDEMQQHIAAEQIQRKYGSITSILAGKNPELRPLELVWPRLSADHKRAVVALADTLAARDREKHG